MAFFHAKWPQVRFTFSPAIATYSLEHYLLHNMSWKICDINECIAESDSVCYGHIYSEWHIISTLAMRLLILPEAHQVAFVERWSHYRVFKMSGRGVATGVTAA